MTVSLSFSSQFFLSQGLTSLTSFLFWCTWAELDSDNHPGRLRSLLFFFFSMAINHSKAPKWWRLKSDRWYEQCNSIHVCYVTNSKDHTKAWNFKSRKFHSECKKFADVYALRHKTALQVYSPTQETKLEANTAGDECTSAEIEGSAPSYTVCDTTLHEHCVQITFPLFSLSLFPSIVWSSPKPSRIAPCLAVTWELPRWPLRVVVGVTTH